MKRLLLVAVTSFVVLSTTPAYTQSPRPAFPQASINGKSWMAVNLEARKFRNGAPVPEARTPQEWKKATEGKQPAWCYYNNDAGAGHGVLYNWFAATDPRGLCPAGWRMPAAEEFSGLITASGGEEVAGIVLKSIEGWSGGANGNNSSGFNARPGGYRSFDGEFQNLGDYGMWWSADKGNNIVASYLVLVNIGGASSVRDGNKGDGYSIRCVKSAAAGAVR